MCTVRLHQDILCCLSTLIKKKKKERKKDRADPEKVLTGISRMIGDMEWISCKKKLPKTESEVQSDRATKTKPRGSV